MGVDFAVDRGEIVGLLGPNGAGKTTTFRMTCGLIDADQGQVMLNGLDVTNWPMYRRSRERSRDDRLHFDPRPHDRTRRPVRHLGTGPPPFCMKIRAAALENY